MFNASRSPFKFLDPYDKKDIQFFFGRDKETDLLYDMVSKNRIVLVYGQSGTGKTSIIQCGLANAFDPTDWMPFFIRREENINDAVLKVLLKENIPPNENETLLIRERLFGSLNGNDSFTDYEKKYLSLFCYKLEKVTQKYLRPVYLIFDQFEELFILGTDDERSLFLKTLKTIVNHDEVIDCHIIIVMREEYFAWMDMFEAEIPEIVDRRLRIEPMRRKEIKEVITKSFQHFNIRLQEPNGDVEQIMKTLTGHEEKREVALTYLQVHLDQLWKKDYEHTYPEGYKGTEKYPPLEFTSEEIRAYSEKKEEIMQNFLVTKKNLVLSAVRSAFENSEISDDLITRILDCFVNDKGTKIPNSFKHDDGIYKFRDPHTDEFLTQYDPKILSYAIDTLLSQQILRSDGKRLELGHDILARLIDRQREGIQRERINIRLMIAYYVDTNKRIPYESIKTWEKDVDQLNLPAAHRKFFEDSREAGYREAVAKDIEFAIEKQQSEFRIKKRVMLKGIFLGMAILLVFILWLERRNKQRIHDTTYAVNAFSTLNGLNDKVQAMHYGKYIADFKDYDSNTTKSIEAGMIKLATHPTLATQFASKAWKLKSAQSLASGSDVDIAADGQFIIIKNDTAQINFGVWNYQNQPKSFTYELYDTSKKTRDTVFNEIHYAYFLNRPGLLLLAKSSYYQIGFEAYPDKIIIYDCVKRITLANIDISIEKDYPCFFYSREYLKLGSNREWDSYKIRITASGKLIVPYIGLIEKNKRREAEGFVEIRSMDDEIVARSRSGFSVSLSHDNNKIIYVYRGKNGRFQYEMCSENGDTTWLVENAGFVDFTQSGNIIYHRGSDLVLMNFDRKILGRANIPTPVRNILTGRNDNYAIIEYRNNNSAIVNLKTGKVVEIPGSLMGFNFERQHITIYDREKSNLEQAVILVKKFEGTEVARFICPKNFESFAFNSASKSLLVKSNRTQPSGMQILYLLDDTLAVRGSFFLTPNDAFDFSNDGRSFYFVRDNELSTYENKSFLDISNYKSIYAWLEKVEEKNKFDPKAFRTSNKLSRFPSQTIF